MGEWGKGKYGKWENKWSLMSGGGRWSEGSFFVGKKGKKNRKRAVLAGEEVGKDEVKEERRSNGWSFGKGSGGGEGKYVRVKFERLY